MVLFASVVRVSLKQAFQRLTSSLKLKLWLQATSCGPGERIKQIIVVTREEWENQEPRLIDGARYHPLAMCKTC
jgi:hypothetical protein